MKRTAELVGDVRAEPVAIAGRASSPDSLSKRAVKLVGFMRCKPRVIINGAYLAVVLAAVVYYAFIASDMYVSDAVFTVRGSESQNLSVFGALLSGAGGISASDTHVVNNYIHSRDMLDELDRRLDLKAMYSMREADFISRLSPDATPEEALEYFKRRILIVYEPDTLITTLTVRAFTAEDAKRIAENIIEISESLVNTLSARAQEDALKLARNEIARAEERVMASRLKVKQFRDVSGNIDPEAATKSIITIIGGLEEQSAKMQAELSELRSYLQEGSPQVVALKARINAVEGQIAREKKRLTGKEADTLNELIHEYEKLWVEREFAEKQYATALSALEIARVEAEKKHRYLVTFVKPALAEESLYPKRVKTVIVILIGAVLLYGILSLVVAAVQEHAGL